MVEIATPAAHHAVNLTTSTFDSPPSARATYPGNCGKPVTEISPLGRVAREFGPPCPTGYTWPAMPLYARLWDDHLTGIARPDDADFVWQGHADTEDNAFASCSWTDWAGNRSRRCNAG